MTLVSQRRTARPPRIMLYSHDTFGLGHLRRSRALAQAITQEDPAASALILTGSPVAGRFDFPRRVDHVRLPGVTKRRDGSYVSQTMGMDIDETTELRSALIRSTAEQYDPDVLIVDKEPTGFRGELMPTLEMLHAEGRTMLVLGLLPGICISIALLGVNLLGDALRDELDPKSASAPSKEAI